MAAAAILVPIIGNESRSLGREDDEENLTQSMNVRLAGFPRELRPYFAKAGDLALLEKINTLNMAGIEEDDIMALIDTLAPEIKSDNKLQLSRLRLLLCSPLLENSLNQEEADILLADLMENNKDEDRAMLTCEEILLCMRDSEGSKKFVTMRKANNDPNAITRQHFCDHIKDVTDRNDAFITLPITAIYVGIFVYLVMGHLRIFDRQLLEKSMQEYVNGRDPRETADENVDDIDSWWEWVMVPGTRGPFAKVVNNSANHPHCIMASRNILLGDVQMSYTKFDGSEGDNASIWLLHSTIGQAHLAANPRDYWNAAAAAALYLQNNGWSDKEIDYLYLRFNGYNEFERMFSMTDVWLPLKRSGDTRTVINTAAFSCEAYPTVSLLVLDIIFLTLVAWILIGELKEACGALRLGIGEFKDYLQFWNIVDWINIVLCGAIVFFWMLIVGAMHASSIQDLLDDDYELKVDVMQLTSQQLEDLDSSLKLLRRLFLITHFILAFNTASVVLKFFKAFESNRRLRVVTDTFKAALEDLIHFFITFTTIYLPFCLIAHIMFGNDIADFCSIVASLNAGFVVLMGDFGWYVDGTSGMIVTQVLPSGMPVLFLLVWYWAYMFLMFLVLLNMLLAVVMEHYIKVVGELEQVADKPTIWKQAAKWVAFQKETKPFKALMKLRMDLDNDNAPAHPQEDVSAESLVEAWPDMKPAQAEWIMKWLEKYIAGKNSIEKDNETQIAELSEENRLLALSNAKKIDDLCSEVMGNKSRIDDMNAMAADSSSPGASGMVTADNYQEEMVTLTETLKELVGSLGKVRKDQERLARRVEELALAVPQDAKLAKIAGGKKLDLSVEGEEPDAAAAGSSVREKKEKKEKKMRP